MSKKNISGNAKRAAYEKKQEKQGERIVKWIIGVLIVLALAYAAYSVYIVSF